MNIELENEVSLEKAARQALEALESCTPEDTSTGHVVWPSYDEQAVQQAITALRRALEQQPAKRTAEEPYGYFRYDLRLDAWVQSRDSDQGVAFYTRPQPAAAPEQEPVKLRRGDVLRCIETDELCTVWATSTTHKTLVKWGGNDFSDYTAEQIGELFWLEPESEDVEIAAEQSDNYAAFHAGVRFARAHSFTTPKQEEVEIDWPDYHEQGMGCGLEDRGITDRYEAMRYGWDEALDKVVESVNLLGPLYTHPAPAAQRQWVGLTDEEIYNIYDQVAKQEPYSGAVTRRNVARAIEAKLRAVNGFSCDATEKNGSKA